MDKAKQLLRGEPAYEPIHDVTQEEQPISEEQLGKNRRRFSWVEYGIFLLLGIAMLWAW